MTDGKPSAWRLTWVSTGHSITVDSEAEVEAICRPGETTVTPLWAQADAVRALLDTPQAREAVAEGLRRQARRDISDTPRWTEEPDSPVWLTDADDLLAALLLALAETTPTEEPTDG